jgi:hypothetical protein
MDTSTDYITALNMSLEVFLDCFETLSSISETRAEEMKKSVEAVKNKK